MVSYSPPPTFPVEVVNVLLPFNDPDILTGKLLYAARAGDIIDFDSLIATYQVFDGTTPRMHLLVQGEVVGTDDIVTANSLGVLDFAYKDSAGLRITYQANYTQFAAGFYFQNAGNLIAILDDGAGGDPGCTQGRAEARLVIIHRAGAQPSRATYPIVAADDSQQWFQIAGSHAFDFTLGAPSAGQPFVVLGSLSNDGPYTASDGNQRSITAINQLAHEITLAGMTHTTLRLPVGTVFTITGSTGNDGTYTVASCDDLTATVSTVEALPDATPDGVVTLPAAVYLTGSNRTLVWVLGSTIVDGDPSGEISL